MTAQPTQPCRKRKRTRDLYSLCDPSAHVHAAAHKGDTDTEIEYGRNYAQRADRLKIGLVVSDNNGNPVRVWLTENERTQVEAAQVTGPEDHPCDKCGEMVPEDEFCGNTRRDGTSEYLCPDCYVPDPRGKFRTPDCYVLFSINGVDYRGTVETVREDEADVIGIVPTVDGDDSATLPAAILVIDDHV